MRKLLSPLVIMLLLLFCGSAFAKEINAEYARGLLQPMVQGSANECENLSNELNSLNASQLSALHALILEDRNKGAGKIVQPNFALYYRFAANILNNIDNILGRLPFDLMVEGELLASDELATTVAWYNIKTRDGKRIMNVFVGVSTVKPYCGFIEELNVPYRLYLKGQEIIKIEELE